MHRRIKSKQGLTVAAGFAWIHSRSSNSGVLLVVDSTIPCHALIYRSNAGCTWEGHTISSTRTYQHLYIHGAPEISLIHQRLTERPTALELLWHVCSTLPLWTRHLMKEGP